MENNKPLSSEFSLLRWIFIVILVLDGAACLFLYSSHLSFYNSYLESHYNKIQDPEEYYNEAFRIRPFNYVEVDSSCYYEDLEIDKQLEFNQFVLDRHMQRHSDFKQVTIGEIPLVNLKVEGNDYLMIIFVLIIFFSVLLNETLKRIIQFLSRSVNTLFLNTDKEKKQIDFPETLFFNNKKIVRKDIWYFILDINKYSVLFIVFILSLLNCKKICDIFIQILNTGFNKKITINNIQYYQIDNLYYMLVIVISIYMGFIYWKSFNSKKILIKPLLYGGVVILIITGLIYYFLEVKKAIIINEYWDSQIIFVIVSTAIIFHVCCFTNFIKKNIAEINTLGLLLNDGYRALTIDRVKELFNRESNILINHIPLSMSIEYPVRKAKSNFFIINKGKTKDVAFFNLKFGFPSSLLGNMLQDKNKLIQIYDSSNNEINNSLEDLVTHQEIKKALDKLELEQPVLEESKKQKPKGETF